MSYCPHCGAQVESDFEFCKSCGKSVSGQQVESPPMAQPAPSKSNKKIFLLVGCAVAFVGFIFVAMIAAIAVPNLLNAIQRGKQKRTMADMRIIGTMMGTYEIDHNQYPLDLEELEAAGFGRVPRHDGWTNPWVIEFSRQEYTIVSLGKNGTADGADFYGGVTSTFNSDIVYSCGTFVQYPDGKQTNN